MNERKWIERYTLKVDSSSDFPDGPVVKTSSSSARGMDSIPGQGVKNLTCFSAKRKKKITESKENIVIDSIKT